MNEGYAIAGIDVHKSMLAVVVTEIAAGGEFHFERRKFGAMDSDLKALSQWLAEWGVREVVMESTAQYWKPVWRQLERQCVLHLAQAQSNQAPRGRKRDFPDAERLVRRHVAGELILSFVPDLEQRLWRTITRTKYQLTRDRVRLQNQLESLLEDGRLKLGTCVSDLLGVSSRRMLRAIAKGERDTTMLAALAEENLNATPEQLADAMSGADAEPVPSADPQIVSGPAGSDRAPTRYPAPSDRPGPSPTSGGSHAAGHGTGPWCRLGAADDRRSGTYGRHLSFGAAVGILGGRMSRPRRIRRGVEE